MAGYVVKEIFSTLQGEGTRVGTAAVFLRLAGCNLWSGLQSGRAKGNGACARWCDTAFVGGQSMTSEDIYEALEQAWRADVDCEKWVVITGGEPLLQLDFPLLEELAAGGWKIAVETNGTLDPEIEGTHPSSNRRRVLDYVDHLCVSPKLGGELKVKKGQELKVILPGAAGGEDGWTDEALRALEQLDFQSFYVQPQDPVHVGQIGETYLHGGSSHPYLALDYQAHLNQCIAWVQRRPRWRLSAQLHKFVHLP